MRRSSTHPIEVLEEEVPATGVASEVRSHGAHGVDPRLASQKRDVAGPGPFSQ